MDLTLSDVVSSVNSVEESVAMASDSVSYSSTGVEADSVEESNVGHLVPQNILDQLFDKMKSFAQDDNLHNFIEQSAEKDLQGFEQQLRQLLGRITLPLLRSLTRKISVGSAIKSPVVEKTAAGTSAVDKKGDNENFLESFVEKIFE